MTVAPCDSQPGSPPPHIPRWETGMPQHAPGHEILPPVPVPPPLIPRLEPPLVDDQQRFIELQNRLSIYMLIGPAIDFEGFMGRLERAVPIERHIEAALVDDGYDPNRIRGRIHDIRALLFTDPSPRRVRLLSETTLDQYLNEIQTNGTRQSVPYRRVVQAMDNFELLL